MVERHERLISQVRTILATWFFVGMPLSMTLNGLYFVAGVPLPALLFFLSSMVYLSGSLLGVLWSEKSLRKRGFSSANFIGTLLVLAVSIGFLFLGIAFAVIALRRL
jgi:hypothetical protein